MKGIRRVGIAKNIKRVCGASVGAITASLVAVGYTSEDLKEFMETDLKKVLVGKFWLMLSTGWYILGFHSLQRFLLLSSRLLMTSIPSSYLSANDFKEEGP